MRSAMHALLASYLERGPLMWMMPLHLHVNKKSDYDDMIREVKTSKCSDEPAYMCSLNRRLHI